MELGLILPPQQAPRMHGHEHTCAHTRTHTQKRQCLSTALRMTSKLLSTIDKPFILSDLNPPHSFIQKPS